MAFEGLVHLQVEFCGNSSKKNVSYSVRDLTTGAELEMAIETTEIERIASEHAAAGGEGVGGSAQFIDVGFCFSKIKLVLSDPLIMTKGRSDQSTTTAQTDQRTRT